MRRGTGHRQSSPRARRSSSEGSEAARRWRLVRTAQEVFGSPGLFDEARLSGKSNLWDLTPTGFSCCMLRMLTPARAGVAGGGTKAFQRCFLLRYLARWLATQCKEPGKG
jgi:hypothetical protein